MNTDKNGFDADCKRLKASGSETEKRKLLAAHTELDHFVYFEDENASYYFFSHSFLKKRVNYQKTLCAIQNSVGNFDFRILLA